MRRRDTGLLAAAAAILWLATMSAHLARQETPTGWLRGTAVAEESGQPLVGAEVRLHLMGVAPDVEQRSFVLRTRAGGAFRSKRIPAGVYRVEASSRAHILDPTSLVVAEGEAKEVALELKPVPPFFDLRIPQHVFTPDEVPQVIGEGFLPDDAAAFTVYRVDAAFLFGQHYGSLWQMLRADQLPEPLALEDNPNLALSQRLSAPITQRDVEGVFRQRFDLPIHEPGVYLVAAEAAHIQRLEWIMVTRIGLVAKHWGDEGLAYVIDLKTGQPVPGARVEFTAVGGPTVSGTTDEQGIFQHSLPGGEPPFTLLARAEKDGSEAFTTERVWRTTDDSQDRVYLYTDRPVYRPGHRVLFKGVARRFADNAYSVPSQEPVEVEVRDSRDTLVYRGKLATNEFGSYHGEFDLNDEAATGSYQVISTLAGRPHWSQFDVAEYRKPEYSVDVTPKKKRYTRGDRIQADVSAQYYFGAPVAGAEVSYIVRRDQYWFYPFGREQGIPEDFESYGYGEVIDSGETRTDDAGLVRLSIPTKSVKRPSWAEPEQEATDYLYTVEVTVTDPSRKSVVGSATVLVTQGEFALSARPRRYIASPGDTAEIAIEAKDYDGKPVPGVKISVEAGPETWTGGESEVETEVKRQVTTDSKGEAVFSFKPRSQGYYRIQLETRDKRKNTIRASDFLWVTGETYADFGGVYPDLEIVTDKDTYRKGETATLLINSQRKGATALLTVEGPRLYEHRLLELKGNSTRVDLPIRDDYAPNCFVSVSFVHDKQYVSQQKEIEVSVEDRKLLIDVKPNKARYAPGEQVTYQVRTTDWQGSPVSAEVSLGVVDESIYAIRKDAAPPMLGFFYPPRPNDVSTSYSFPYIYLDADKAGAGIEVRKRFPDTAYWNPTVVTSPDGRAEISFAMPDALTTWRATARGATLDTAVGESIAKVTCTKDLLVRLEAPRFFVQRDRLQLSALVHNYTKSEQRVQVWIDAPGLRFPGGAKAKKPPAFSLKPDGVKRTEWEVEIPDPGLREITVYAKAESGLTDAMALTLPALPHGRERTEWRSGAITESKEERLTVRTDAVPGASEVRVRLAPSLASVLLGGLDYLAQYPYGCTEQTMSAFLPDVVVAKVLRELDISNPKLQSQLPKMVQKGLDRLYGYQHDDGGWGWWRYDESDPWMTAYVIYGMTLAKENGFFVNENARTRGIEWLMNHLRQQNADQLSAERLYALYVLTLAGKDEVVDPPLRNYYRNLSSLDSHRLALLTSAFLQRGRTREARAVANRLWQQAEQTQSVISWKGREGWGRGGDSETTALAFQALCTLDPRDDRLFKIVRWFVLQRQGNHWVSTRDTSFALLALTGFLEHSQELKPDYQASVALNGKPLLERRFAREHLFDPEVEVKAPAGALRQGNNTLTVSKDGPGTLYYTIIFRQFVGGEDLPKVVGGSGISVRRAYYPLVTQRDRRSGVITTSPAPKPTTDLRSGQQILVKLTVNSPREYEFVVVEDPIPAGCEVAERPDVEPWEWDRWWSDMDVRDEKVAVFARRLPAGVSTIEYYLAPQIPGEYHVMPTQVWAMYNPDLRGSGAETRVKLR